MMAAMPTLQPHEKIGPAWFLQRGVGPEQGVQYGVAVVGGRRVAVFLDPARMSELFGEPLHGQHEPAVRSRAVAPCFVPTVALGMHRGQAVSLVEVPVGIPALRLWQTVGGRPQPLPLPVALHVATHLAAALATLSALVVDAAGNPKLHVKGTTARCLHVDWNGEVKLLPTTHRVHGGTPEEMSPELVRGIPTVPRTWTFQVGGWLRRVLAAQAIPASDFDVLEQVRSGPPPLAQVAPTSRANSRTWWTPWNAVNQRSAQHCGRWRDSWPRWPRTTHPVERTH